MASNFHQRFPFGLPPPPPPLPPPQLTDDFQAHQELDTSNTFGGGTREYSHYQSITFVPHHQRFSFEELRLNDNAHGKGTVVRESTGNFTAEANGLAFAQVPPLGNPGSLFGGTNIFCRTSTTTAARLGAKVVTFEIGKDTPQHFVVHENLIAPRSEFVRLALNNDWKEARNRTIPLPEDYPEAFELYQEFIYTNRIPSNSFGDSTKDASEYNLLVQAYILGERFMDAQFKDAIIDCIIQKLRISSYFDTRLTNLVYDNTPTTSCLRRLWQDIYVWSGNPSWLDEKMVGDFIHAEFALDLSRYQMSLNRNQGPRTAPFVWFTCAYHEHVNGLCYRSRGQAS